MKLIIVISIILGANLLSTNSNIMNYQPNDSLITFDYKIQFEETKRGDFHMKAELKNISNDTINILSYSCYGLLNNLKHNKNEIRWSLFWHCNGSFHESVQFLPGEIKTFDNDFDYINKNLDSIKIGYNLMILKKNYSREELEELKRWGNLNDAIQKETIIWGPTIKKQ